MVLTVESSESNYKKGNLAKKKINSNKNFCLKEEANMKTSISSFKFLCNS